MKLRKYNKKIYIKIVDIIADKPAHEPAVNVFLSNEKQGRLLCHKFREIIPVFMTLFYNNVL